MFPCIHHANVQNFHFINSLNLLVAITSGCCEQTTILCRQVQTAIRGNRKLDRNSKYLSEYT